METNKIGIEDRVAHKEFGKGVVEYIHDFKKHGFGALVKLDQPHSSCYQVDKALSGIASDKDDLWYIQLEELNLVIDE